MVTGDGYFIIVILTITPHLLSSQLLPSLYLKVLSPRNTESKCKLRDGVFSCALGGCLPSWDLQAVTKAQSCLWERALSRRAALLQARLRTPSSAGSGEPP